MKRLAVFYISSNGASDYYREGAVQFGKELAKHRFRTNYWISRAKEVIIENQK